tara:strand:+ start:249 stop:509 length:261 start_codon:yes stop_codon:yes gene_type:complete
MNTLFLLMARHDGKPVISVDDICADYFTHLNPVKFLRKVRLGEIDLPVVAMEDSQKAARGVHLEDLAKYLDARRAAAARECHRLRS